MLANAGLILTLPVHFTLYLFCQSIGTFTFLILSSPKTVIVAGPNAVSVG